MSLAEFKSTDAAEIGNKIIEEMVGVASEWWQTNSAVMAGYVRSLSEATAQTQQALEDGLIDGDTAEFAMQMHKAAFRTTVRFTKVQTMALAQRLVDAAFSVVGWVIYNRTNLNIMPHLVKP